MVCRAASQDPGAAGTTTPAPALTAPYRPGGTGITEEYAYDAGGARVSRTLNGVTTVYFGLYERDSTGSERWYYGIGGTVAQRERTARA